MSIKFLYNSYPSNCQGGGAVIKINKMRSFLQARGHQVDLYNPWESNIGDYDIYHHFSMFPADLPMIRFAKATGVKVAIETMYWASWKHAITASSSSFPGYLRRVGRYSLRRILARGTRERAILDIADSIMVNSEFERENVIRDFSISPDKVVVCPNGADATFKDATPELFEETYGLKDFVLVTGLFEERKNQLSLIKAMSGLDVPLVLIGGAPSVHDWYYRKCKDEAGANVHFIDFINHDDPLFRSAYAACKVLALPSWHETTGKSALEGGLLSKNIIMTTYAPAAKEYFKDFVFYVNPKDIGAMRKAVLQAIDAPPAIDLKSRILKNFTWDKVLERRECCYRDML